jgi:hypothetical protein
MLVLGAALSRGGAHADAVAPAAGYYALSVSNGVITGRNCNSLGLFSYAGVASLYWPGADAAGAVLRKTEQLSHSTTGIRIIHLPRTPATASSTWSGLVFSTVTPAGESPNGMHWAATVTYIDAASFLIDYVITAKTSVGFCKLTNRVQLLRTS